MSHFPAPQSCDAKAAGDRATWNGFSALPGTSDVSRLGAGGQGNFGWAVRTITTLRSTMRAHCQMSNRGVLESDVSFWLARGRDYFLEKSLRAPNCARRRRAAVKNRRPRAAGGRATPQAATRIATDAGPKTLTGDSCCSHKKELRRCHKLVASRAGLIGCIKAAPRSPTDLSTNPKHMEGFGRA